MQVAVSFIEKFRMWKVIGCRTVGTVKYSLVVGLVNSFDSIAWFQVLSGFSWLRTLSWIVFETGQGRMSSYSPAEIEGEIEAQVPMTAANPYG